MSFTERWMITEGVTRHLHNQKTELTSMLEHKKRAGLKWLNTKSVGLSVQMKFKTTHLTCLSNNPTKMNNEI